MRIIFSEVANISYENIIEFLSETWTEKQINMFIDEAEKVVGKLKDGKFKLYQKHSKDIRSALIGKTCADVFQDGKSPYHKSPSLFRHETGSSKNY